MGEQTTEPKETPAPPVEDTQILALPAMQQLVVERSQHSCVLKIVGKEQRVRLWIEIGPTGSIIHLAGEGMSLQVDGDLALEAERIALHGRSGVALSTGGDLALSAEVDMHVTSRLGDINLKANDYVRLKGELIKLNC
jgi:hypothetical protein